MCSNGNVFEYGIRRHPEDTSIDGDESTWWYSTKDFESHKEYFGETFCKEIFSDDINQLFTEFGDLLEKTSDVVHDKIEKEHI